jgi:transketolase
VKVREQASTREAYGKTLAALGRELPDLVVLDADLSKSTMTKYFAAEFPDRFFQCGIAEQNMMGIAAGLAASGKTAFASTFAVFATGRCFDQLRMSISQPRLNVKVVATHGGITVGEDGLSHHSIEDLALACALPGFSVVVPADDVETAQVIKLVCTTDGPFYVRLGRGKVPRLFDSDYRVMHGRAVTLRQGVDATIVATGLMTAKAIEAAESLSGQGIECRVLHMPWIKPLDEEAVVQAATQTGAIVTAEEHLQHGGLGSRVAQVVARSRPVPMDFVAIKDTYAQSGTPDELLERYGLTGGDIERAVKSTIQRKKAT